MESLDTLKGRRSRPRPAGVAFWGAGNTSSPSGSRRWSRSWWEPSLCILKVVWGGVPAVRTALRLAAFRYS